MSSFMDWRTYQQSQKVADVGRHFVSYIDQGAGDAVVLIHGIPTWGYLWHQQLPVLAAAHRVLIPDLVGFGHSDKRDCFDRSIARQAEVIDQWMDAVGINSATIVAHDIGGGVALRLATLFPHRVQNLCVMNSICYDSWPIELMLQAGHPGAYHQFSAPTANKMLGQALKQGFSKSPDTEVLEGLLAPYRTEVGKLSMVRNAASLNTNLTTEITDRLQGINCPVLILWGEDDKFQLLKFARRLAWDIPNAVLVTIGNARHFVMLDQPEQVNRYLLDFLQGQGHLDALNASSRSSLTSSR